MFERFASELPNDNVQLTKCDVARRAWPGALESFWSICGSGYFGGLALHVFGDGYEEAFHDIEKWNAHALSFFRWLVPDSYVAFAEDPFGTQFFFDSARADTGVYSLVIQDAQLYEAADSLDRFFDDLLDEDKRDALLNYSYYIDCLTEGFDHQPGRHLTLKVPRCLGGSEAMGLRDVDAVSNVTYLGQLLEQARDVSPAELARRIRFSTT